MNVCTTFRPDINPLPLRYCPAYHSIISICRIYISHHEVILCRRLMGLVARGISIITVIINISCQIFAIISYNIIKFTRIASITLKQIIPIPSVATSRNIVICNKSFYICLRVNPLFPYIIHIFSPLEWFTLGHTHQAQNKHTTLRRCHTYELKYVTYLLSSCEIMILSIV